jgi:DNA-binding transcriptional regulator YhcF (GntR family)/DNA-binding XRE family transcriptional regulator
MTTAGGLALPKYLRVAAVIRRQIADGSLRPGQPAPSGAELSRAFGFSTLTCRKALRALIAEGLLVPGPSPNARPRVADPQAPDLERDLAHAARALSAGLAGRRHAAGLTQAELAELAGVSVTTVGHAETGRTWQSRRFWERADTALRAAGDLLRLHDAYRAASSPTVSPTRPATAALPASPAHPFHVPPSQALASQASPSQALVPLTPLPPTLASQTAPAMTGPAQIDPALTAPAQAGPAQAGPAQAGIAEVDRSRVRSSQAEAAEAGTTQGAPCRVGPSPVGPSRIVIVWTDGSITTVHAPEILAGPSEATFPDLDR